MDISNQILCLKINYIKKEMKIRAIGSKNRKKLIFGLFSATWTNVQLLMYLPSTYLWYSSSVCTDSARLCYAQVKKTPISSIESSKSALILAGTTTWAPYAALAATTRGRRQVPALTSYPCHRLWELVAVGVWVIPFSKHHAKETSRWDLEFRSWFFCFLSWLKANLGRGQDHRYLN